MTIDERLAQLKPGDEIRCNQGFGAWPAQYVMHQGRQVVVRSHGTAKLYVVDAATNILWPPAPTATPGVVYRHKDGGREAVGLADGRLRICCALDAHVYVQPVFPFTSDWLPVDPQEGPKP